MSVSAAACYLCAGTDTYDFFEWPPLPTQDGIMCASEAEASKVARGAIKLRYCRRCGFVGNEGHEASKVQFDQYDFSNHSSPIYSRFTSEVSQRLINCYNLKAKSILEIGCGQGDFLRSICSKGHNIGIGIDPGFDHSMDAESDAAKVEFLREYYSVKHASIRSDLVVSRHLISLPSDPLSFLRLLRSNLSDQTDTIVYLETPNVRNTFGERNIWNVVYEHRSWYSRESLGYMLQLAGFEVLNSGECWNNAYLFVEARAKRRQEPPELPSAEDLADLSRCIDSVAEEFSALMSRHALQACEIRALGNRAVAWGSGAAAVSYFNLFDLREAVPYIVDINPSRHGKFLPGSGQKIMAPSFIQSYQPELLIITNPTYESEIREQVHGLGVNPRILTL